MIVVDPLQIALPINHDHGNLLFGLPATQASLSPKPGYGHSADRHGAVLVQVRLA
jgi:hypothetical protein